MENLNNNIQCATLDNLKDLERLSKICDTHKTPNKMIWDINLLKTFYYDKNAKIYVFNKANVIGGVIARYNNDYSKLHIYNIFVDPNYQNSGIGKSLIRSLIEDAASHGTEYICTLNTKFYKYFEKLNFFKGKIYLWHKLDPFNCQKQNNMI